MTLAHDPAIWGRPPDHVKGLCHHPSMYSTELPRAFRAALSERGLTVAQLDASESVEAVTDFYLSQRFEDVDVSSDGDALLFQWGTYDWGYGPSFQFDLTRQTVSGSRAEDDDIWQLSLTLHYDASTESAVLGEGNHWCWKLDDVPEFRRYIASLDCTQFAIAHSPARIELHHSSV